jgi:catechol 2,3-dioxygenase-like lactoylglutathione lyase family enzyme
MIRSRGLTHIQLSVRDLQRSVRFYQSVLGLRKKFEGDAATAFLTTPGANDIITLNAAGDRTNAGESGGIAHFGFQVEGLSDFERALAEAATSGGQVVRRGVRETEDCPEESWAFVKDPDGYLFEIYAPYAEVK